MKGVFIVAIGILLYFLVVKLIIRFDNTLHHKNSDNYTFSNCSNATRSFVIKFTGLYAVALIGFLYLYFT